MGADPSHLATDLHALIRRLARDTSLTADDDLLEAAGYFLGNAIASAYPRSTWKVLREAHVGPGPMGGLAVITVVRAVVNEPHRVEEFIETLDRSMRHADDLVARHEQAPIEDD